MRPPVFYNPSAAASGWIPPYSYHPVSSQITHSHPDYVMTDNSCKIRWTRLLLRKPCRNKLVSFTNQQSVCEGTCGEHALRQLLQKRSSGKRRGICGSLQPHTTRWDTSSTTSTRVGRHHQLIHECGIGKHSPGPTHGHATTSPTAEPKGKVKRKGTSS